MVDQIGAKDLITEGFDSLTLPAVSGSFTKEQRDDEASKIKYLLSQALGNPFQEHAGKFVVVDVPQVQALAAAIQQAYENDRTGWRGELNANPLNMIDDPANPGTKIPEPLSAPEHVTQIVRERVMDVTDQTVFAQ